MWLAMLLLLPPASVSKSSVEIHSLFELAAAVGAGDHWSGDGLAQLPTSCGVLVLMFDPAACATMRDPSACTGRHTRARDAAATADAALPRRHDAAVRHMSAAGGHGSALAAALGQTEALSRARPFPVM
jgi:hypothetical protein